MPDDSVRRTQLRGGRIACFLIVRWKRSGFPLRYVVRISGNELLVLRMAVYKLGLTDRRLVLELFQGCEIITRNQLAICFSIGRRKGAVAAGFVWVGWFHEITLGYIFF